MVINVTCLEVVLLFQGLTTQEEPIPYRRALASRETKFGYRHAHRSSSYKEKELEIDRTYQKGVLLLIANEIHARVRN